MQEIPEWFIGCRLNYAENLLQGNDDDIALYIAGNFCFSKDLSFFFSLKSCSNNS